MAFLPMDFGARAWQAPVRSLRRARMDGPTYEVLALRYATHQNRSGLGEVTGLRWHFTQPLNHSRARLQRRTAPIKIEWGYPGRAQDKKTGSRPIFRRGAEHCTRRWHEVYMYNYL